ncbi:unnamed protein product, partial [Prorocentrum cordatum]
FAGSRFCRQASPRTASWAPVGLTTSLGKGPLPSRRRPPPPCAPSAGAQREKTDAERWAPSCQNLVRPQDAAVQRGQQWKMIARCPAAISRAHVSTPQPRETSGVGWPGRDAQPLRIYKPRWPIPGGEQSPCPGTEAAEPTTTDRRAR